MWMTYTEDQIAEVAEKLIQVVPSKILCFYGEMGSGKTTLIKGIVKQLVVEEVNNPTNHLFKFGN